MNHRPLPPAGLRLAVKNSTLALVAVFAFAATARAEVKLPALFTDHMVLQQGKPVAVWGWADSGEEVTVEFGKQKVKTTARDGKWSVKLKPLKASDKSAKLVVTGKNQVEVNDVVVGEVWVASGQSNMQWSMAQSAGTADDIKNANSTRLRLFYVPRVKQDAPAADVKAKWTHSNPGTVKEFSAVAYYFGKDLQAALKVPVGIIHTSWGGSPAEVWMSDDVLAGNADYQRTILDNYQTQRKNYENALAQWEKEKAAAEQAGQEFKKNRPGLGWKPTELYNGMIAPLIPYGINGAIWYQGESNAGRAYQYRSLMADLIKNWRRDWGQGDFTFLQVQLAPYDKRRTRSLAEITKEPVESDWAELREAQVHVTKVLPKAGIAVITDVGDKDDIHPGQKKPVGQRLALAAQAIAYGKKLNYSGPMYKSVKFDDGKAVISFDHAAKGLAAGMPSSTTLPGGEATAVTSPVTPTAETTYSYGGGIEIVVGSDAKLTGFQIAGEDKKFYWADAVIRGKTVVVSSPNVPKPVSVRYGWSDYPVVNLYNSAGLPASPFRTDDWPGVTWPK
jgi:sialate O-acetylesterase